MVCFSGDEANLTLLINCIRMVVWLFSKGTWRIYRQNLEHIKMYWNSMSSKFLSGTPRVQATKPCQMQVVFTSIINLQNQMTLSLLQWHLMGCRMDIFSSGQPLPMEEVNTLIPQSTHTLNQGWAFLLSIWPGKVYRFHLIGVGNILFSCQLMSTS